MTGAIFERCSGRAERARWDRVGEKHRVASAGSLYNRLEIHSHPRCLYNRLEIHSDGELLEASVDVRG